jgi:hypothetical protein
MSFNLPDELLLLVLGFSNNDTLNTMKFINVQWLSFINKHYNSIFNNIVMNSLNNKTEIISNDNYKFHSIVNNNNSNPIYLIIRRNDGVYYAYDIKKRFKLFRKYYFEYMFGTNFVINYEGTVCTADLKDIIAVKVYYHCKIFIVNDYVFESYKSREIIIRDKNGKTKAKIDEHSDVYKIIYQGSKYVIYCNGVIIILNKKFEIIHKIITCDEFIYSHDKFYIVKNSEYYRIIDYDNNILFEIGNKYINTFIINDYMYLITEQGTINIFNLKTYHVETTITYDYHIYEFNNKFMIVGDQDELSYVYF